MNREGVVAASGSISTRFAENPVQALLSSCSYSARTEAVTAQGDAVLFVRVHVYCCQACGSTSIALSAGSHLYQHHPMSRFSTGQQHTQQEGPASYIQLCNISGIMLKMLTQQPYLQTIQQSEGLVDLRSVSRWPHSQLVSNCQ